MFVIIVHVFDFVINEFFVFILQIWAMEHLFSYKHQIPRSGNKYSHIMHWMDVRVGDHEIRRGLRKNMVSFLLEFVLHECCFEFR